MSKIKIAWLGFGLLFTLLLAGCGVTWKELFNRREYKQDPPVQQEFRFATSGGFLNETGRQQELDNNRIEQYQTDAQQGIGNAQYNLGFAYQEGLGIEKNLSQAVRWYRKAAENNIPQAQNQLGILYAQGTVLPKSYVNAYRWFYRAASLGDPHAAKNRDLVAAKMTAGQLTVAQRILKGGSTQYASIGREIGKEGGANPFAQSRSWVTQYPVPALSLSDPRAPLAPKWIRESSNPLVTSPLPSHDSHHDNLRDLPKITSKSMDLAVKQENPKILNVVSDQSRVPEKKDKSSFSFRAENSQKNKEDAKEQSSERFYILLGSFRHERYARECIASIKTDPTQIKKILIKGRTFYRALAGPYSHAEARRKQKEMESSSGLSGVSIIRQPI